jgi:CBS-domain-containing membrane protein
MRADEIMTHNVVSVGLHTTVHDAAALLVAHQITSVPVLDDTGRIVGIVSEVDLIRDRMPRDPRTHLRPEAHEQPDPSRLVAEVMSTTVDCMSRNADTADLAALMVNNRLRAVPITDGGHVIGMVSRRDLLRTLMREDSAVQDEVARRLAEIDYTAPSWKVTVQDGVVTIAGRTRDRSARERAATVARGVPGVLRVHTSRRCF